MIAGPGGWNNSPSSTRCRRRAVANSTCRSRPPRARTRTADRSRIPIILSSGELSSELIPRVPVPTRADPRATVDGFLAASAGLRLAVLAAFAASPRRSSPCCGWRAARRPDEGALAHLFGTVLPALVNTLELALTVLAVVLLIGVSCGWLVAAYEFPGRRRWPGRWCCRWRCRRS